MEANPLEDILKKDKRYKTLEKRSKLIWKRLNAGIRNKNTLFKRMKSMGKQAFALPEIDDLWSVNAKIEYSLLGDHYMTLMEDISFESYKMDGLPSTTIDKYIARQESMVSQREESMAKAEAAQARIKELLDSLEGIKAIAK